MSTADWVKNKLSGFHVTPQRLAIALGLVGILYTRNKNKSKRGWLLISVVSWLLALGGLGSMLAARFG